jgi:prephenate dehydrogenase
LADLSRELQQLRNRLVEEDFASVGGAFDTAREARESIPKNSKGFLRPLSDVYVNANDRPGALLAIVSNLYDAGLSIKDIELLKLREGTGGTFRLGFDNKADSAHAIEVLTADGHQARQL